MISNDTAARATSAAFQSTLFLNNTSERPSSANASRGQGTVAVVGGATYAISTFDN